MKLFNVHELGHTSAIQRAFTTSSFSWFARLSLCCTDITLWKQIIKELTSYWLIWASSGSISWEEEEFNGPCCSDIRSRLHSTWSDLFSCSSFKICNRRLWRSLGLRTAWIEQNQSSPPRYLLQVSLSFTRSRNEHPTNARSSNLACLRALESLRVKKALPHYDPAKEYTKWKFKINNEYPPAL